MIEDTSPGASRTPSDVTDAQIHRFRYDQSSDQSITVSVINAVASVSGVDPCALQPRLYDVIDPDALERLFTTGSAGGNVRVMFQFGNAEVTLTQAGGLIVRAPSPDPVD